jgi:peptidoglycan hydrolase-like protein with peptidoglycan-binding domain
MTDQAQNMAALNDYFNRTAGKTQAAKDAKASWSKWYSGLSFLSKSFTPATWAEAQKRRVAFEAANGEVRPIREVNEAEDAYFLSLPRTDVTGMKPEQAAAAIAAGNKKGAAIAPPATLVAATLGSLRQGSKGDAVKKWQGILGVKQDGVFGPGTAEATKKWQKERGIKADGVVGPATWTAALATSPKGKDAVASVLEKYIETPAATAATQKNFDIAAAVAKPQIQAPPQAAPSPRATATPGTGGRAALRLGSTGDAVREWQAYVGVPVTGTFDSASQSATMNWQSSNGLVADGVVGAASWAKMQTTPKASALKNVTVKTASLLGGGVDKLPLWAKVAGVGAVIGAFAYTAIKGGKGAYRY